MVMGSCRRRKDGKRDVQQRRGTCVIPVNLFMYTKISIDGSISVEAPLSRPGIFLSNKTNDGGYNET